MFVFSVMYGMYALPLSFDLRLGQLLVLDGLNCIIALGTVLSELNDDDDDDVQVMCRCRLHTGCTVSAVMWGSALVEVVQHGAAVQTSEYGMFRNIQQQ